MRTGLLAAVSSILALGGPAIAQNQDAEPVASTMNWFYHDAKDNFLGAAELMPEEHYSFKPTADVRSFGQIVGHIANWQYTNCSAARGQPNPNKLDFEKATTKTEIVARLKAAYA